MKPIAFTLTAVAALLLAGTAQAGCWATVGLSSMPKGIGAGEPWNVAITVKQHGRTLLANAKPTVTITSASNRATVVKARKTARKGIYRARVVFPAAGVWNVKVFDGFVPSCGSDHTFPAVTVRSAADG
jgi:hypothetical protein